MIQTLADLEVKYTAPIPIHCDNTSAISASKNPVFHSNTKHIPIKYHFLREQFTNQVVEVHYIPTTEQIADIFTKPLAKTLLTGEIVHPSTGRVEMVRGCLNNPSHLG